MKKDLSRIRPYGDRFDDGKMQLSFTLPIPAGEQAKEAARLYLEKLGLQNVQVVWMEPAGEGFAFFVAYGQAVPHLRLEQVRVHRPELSILSFDELLRLAREKVKRRIVVVGAATGSDAHTVGIDAILSIKGVSGDKGLEYYPIFRVVNLRAQVSNADLVAQAVELKADAVLVSQLVTQQDQHLANLRELSKMIRGEKRLSPHLVRIVGGPRMDHRTAKSVGFDAGFGPGTKPSEVANYIVHELVRRIGEAKGRLEGEGSGALASKRRSLFGWLSGRGKDS